MEQNLNLESNKSSLRADAYLKLWSPFIFITSVVVLPVKGSTPGYILALFSFFVVLTTTYKTRYVADLSKYILYFMIYYIVSQFFILVSGLHQNGELNYISNDVGVYFRQSHLTQSIYLIPCLLTFLFCRYFYHKKWDSYILAGAKFLAGYGLYGFIYFVVFRKFGDFLSNRTFGINGDFSESLLQTIVIGGKEVMRLKSLTGEPSMYAFSILPFFAFALFRGHKKTACFLLLTLFLSTSTTAILGLFIIMFVEFARKWSVFFELKYIKKYIVAFLSLFIFVYLFKNGLMSLVDFTIAKISLQSLSGIQRVKAIITNLHFFNTLNWYNMLFGIGFGTIRSTDMFSTLLVNTGIFGLMIYIYILLHPVFVLANTETNWGIKHALIVILITSMVSVPEFSYLTIWVVLGFAYKKIEDQKLEKTIIVREYACPGFS